MAGIAKRLPSLSFSTPAGYTVVGIIVFATSQTLIDEFRIIYDKQYTVKWGPITRYGGVNITVSA